MRKTDQYRQVLSGLALDEVADYLRKNSALPGPRGNLELADAFTATAPDALIWAFVDDDDEYLRFCGTQSLGRILVEGYPQGPLLTVLRQRAQDEFWRVREASSRALQIVGDADLGLLRQIVVEWTAAPEAYVVRAAVAGICEPRLLRDSATQQAAIDSCQRATAWIVSLDAASRRRPDVRNLRQALGYCWSVAIAANSEQGLPSFEALQQFGDPDAAWIVASNLKKARLQRLLPVQQSKSSKNS